MTPVEMVWSCLITVILLHSLTICIQQIRRELEWFIAVNDFKRFIVHCKQLAWLVWASFGHDWGKIEYFLHVEKVAFQVPHRIYGGSLLPLHTAVPHDRHQWNLRDENALDLVFTAKWPKKKTVITRSLSYSNIFKSRLLRAQVAMSFRDVSSDFNDAQAPLKLLQGNSTTVLGKGLPSAFRYHGKCRPTRLELHERVVFTGSNDKIPHGQLVKVERLPEQSSSKLSSMFGRIKGQM